MFFLKTDNYNFSLMSQFSRLFCIITYSFLSMFALGDADELVNRSNHHSNGKKSLLSNWRTKKSLNLLNITYDVTPADLVTAVVTELAILPCTSVPVILRIKPSEI